MDPVLGLHHPEPLWGNAAETAASVPRLSRASKTIGRYGFAGRMKRFHSGYHRKITEKEGKSRKLDAIESEKRNSLITIKS